MVFFVQLDPFVLVSLFPTAVSILSIAYLVNGGNFQEFIFWRYRRFIIVALTNLPTPHLPPPLPALTQSGFSHLDKELVPLSQWHRQGGACGFISTQSILQCTHNRALRYYLFICLTLLLTPCTLLHNCQQQHYIHVLFTVATTMVVSLQYRLACRCLLCAYTHSNHH